MELSVLLLLALVVAVLLLLAVAIPPSTTGSAHRRDITDEVHRTGREARRTMRKTSEDYLDQVNDLTRR
jgi:hypothetical protein